MYDTHVSMYDVTVQNTIPKNISQMGTLEGNVYCMALCGRGCIGVDVSTQRKITQCVIKCLTHVYVC